MQEKNDEIDNLSKLHPQHLHLSKPAASRQRDTERPILDAQHDCFDPLFDRTQITSRQSRAKSTPVVKSHHVDEVETDKTGEDSAGGAINLYFSSTADLQGLQMASDDHEALPEPLPIALSSVLGVDRLESAQHGNHKLPVMQQFCNAPLTQEPNFMTNLSPQCRSTSDSADSSIDGGCVTVSLPERRREIGKKLKKSATCRCPADVDFTTSSHDRELVQPLVPLSMAEIDCQAVKCDALLDSLAHGSTNIFDICSIGRSQNAMHHVLDHDMVQQATTALHNSAPRQDTAQQTTGCGDHSRSKAAEHSSSPSLVEMGVIGNVRPEWCNGRESSVVGLEAYEELRTGCKTGGNDLTQTVDRVLPDWIAFEDRFAVNFADWLSTEA